MTRHVTRWYFGAGDGVGQDYSIGEHSVPASGPAALVPGVQTQEKGDRMTLISSLVPLMVPCGVMLNQDNYHGALCFELLLSAAAVARGLCHFSLSWVCKAGLQMFADHFPLNVVTVIWVDATEISSLAL